MPISGCLVICRCETTHNRVLYMGCLIFVHQVRVPFHWECWHNSTLHSDPRARCESEIPRTYGWAPLPDLWSYLPWGKCAGWLQICNAVPKSLCVHQVHQETLSARLWCVFYRRCRGLREDLKVEMYWRQQKKIHLVFTFNFECINVPRFIWCSRLLHHLDPQDSFGYRLQILMNPG